MRMKKFINDPKNLVEELLDGLVLASPDTVRLAGSSIVARTSPRRSRLGFSCRSPAWILSW
jgi:dihydroxyacetone kinase